MRWAKGQGVKVAARGQGHSIYGRALVSDGIVVDMGAMTSIRDIKQDRVVVDAGATWRDLLDATLAQGLTPPVLTNYLGLSVGGTIAVGGIGAASSRHGMQTDNVIALDVVTGEGNEVSCSAAEIRISLTASAPASANAASSRGRRCAWCARPSVSGAFSSSTAICRRWRRTSGAC